MTIMTVTLKEKQVYGVTKYYPSNSVAEIFASIAGTKTLTEETLAKIQKLPNVKIGVETNKPEFLTA